MSEPIGESIEAKDLPPPRISQEKIDRLLKSLSADSKIVADGSSSSTASQIQPLSGRQVLVPAFGGVAFYEGELCPETRSKNDAIDNEEKEEIVYIATSTAEQTKNLSGKKQPNKNEPDEKNISEVKLSEAIEWLRKHSSVDKKSTATTSRSAEAKATEAGTSKASSSSTKQASAKASKKPSIPQSRSHEVYQRPAGPMFNINEEYSADGRRIVGEAVNLSTRLKAVYGDDNPENFNDEDEKEDDSVPTQHEGEAEPISTKTVSDEDYDRIAKRLEELALMEEEETKRIKEGRTKTVQPLGGGSVVKPKKSKSSSSFGFQKGFLNKKKPAKKKTDVLKNQVPTDPKPSSTGGVTIDVSQNKIHEIPREGRQQPVPSRKPQYQTPATQSITANKLLDSSVFSGNVSERSTTMGSQTMSSGVISKDVAARVAANEQTQSLQNELEQQQRQARPKRVSRFRQQRQQEQQQR